MDSSSFLGTPVYLDINLRQFLTLFQNLILNDIHF
jgi:hypothetical protein